METYSRWDQVLTTSLWALTTVCSQRWGELTHNGSTKNDEDVWARGVSIPCLLLKGRMLSVWQCFRKQHGTFHLHSWFFFIKFPSQISSHSSEKSGFHRDFCKKICFQLQLLSHPFKVKFHWFQASHSFPLSSNCSWTGHIFPRTRASWSMDHMTNWSFCYLRRFMMRKTDRNEIGRKQ